MHTHFCTLTTPHHTTTGLGLELVPLAKLKFDSTRWGLASLYKRVCLATFFLVYRFNSYGFANPFRSSSPLPLFFCSKTIPNANAQPSQEDIQSCSSFLTTTFFLSSFSFSSQIRSNLCADTKHDSLLHNASILVAISNSNETTTSIFTLLLHSTMTCIH